MTTQTILPVDSEQLRVLSERNGEHLGWPKTDKKHLSLQANWSFRYLKKQKSNVGI